MMEDSEAATPTTTRKLETGTAQRRSARGSRKRTHADTEEEEENKENHHKDVERGELPTTSLSEVARQSMSIADGLSIEEHNALQDTPSKKRVKRLSGVDSAGKEARKQQEDGLHVDSQNAEEHTQDANIASRTSGRKRKQTWKASDVVDEQPTPSKRRTPASRRKPQPKTNVVPILTVVDAEASKVNPIAEEVVQETPKKKRVKVTKDASGAATAALTDSSAPLLSEPPESFPASVTPTSKKRGRPPKDKSLDEQFLSPGSLLSGSPSKRPRKTNPLLETNGITFSPSTPSKRAKAKADIPTVPVLSWQQYKEAGVEQVERPDPEISRQALEALLEQPEYAQALPQLRQDILECLTGKRPPRLQGLDEEYQKVYAVVEQSIAAGEGNSMLLIGPRGSGKTAVMNSIMASMRAKHPDEFHLIRLNGFIHTDDKVALREIWRQLGREMDVDDESMLERSNYADTLASLLAVLSHPSEQGEPGPGEEGKEGYIAKSVVFVIDEFDLFTTHARQTLLYNLFDIAQSRKAPIAVLGLTTRVDVAESLEKRVKSRFSHRYVFLPRPKSFFAFQQIILAALKAESDDGSSNSGASGPEASIDPALTGKPTHLSGDPLAYSALCEAWSKYVTSLFAPSTNLTSMLRLIYASSRSVPAALSAFLISIASFSSASTIPSDVSMASTPLLAADSKLDLLPSLSDIELALLISAARLDIILNVDTCNFNMAFDEYSTLATKAKIQTSASGVFAVGGTAGGGGAARSWSRDAALAAWERLEILELIMPLATAGYGAGSGLADVGRAGKLMRCDVSLEEINWSALDLGPMMAKWCKEI